MKRLKKKYGCPTELALEFVGGKWKTVILCWLKESPHRYSELRRKMPGISDKVLTERLRDLEALDLVCKEANATDPGRRIWLLTSRGESLRPLLDALYRWGVAAADDLVVDVGIAVRQSAELLASRERIP